MIEPVIQKIKLALETAPKLYYRLVLLVGESGSGKTTALRHMAEELGVTVLNVNLLLADQLMSLTQKQRALRLSGILADIAGRSNSVLLLDNIELLFDQRLQQDPLRLLQALSRNRLVLASWGGSVESGKLFYAKNGHPEYRSYDSVEALVVSMKEQE